MPEKPLARRAARRVRRTARSASRPSARRRSSTCRARCRDQDFPPILYRLAGYGYTVIAPDYTGFSYGQPPGYFNAEDEAHSILDATRAPAKLLTTPPAKVVFVGHSQGGHAALAAQTYAKAYGMRRHARRRRGVGAVVDVDVDLGAPATPTAGGPDDEQRPSSILYTMEYAYSAGQLRGDAEPRPRRVPAGEAGGGEGHAPRRRVLRPAKLAALGATPADFFDADYVSNVGFNCAANPLGSDCTQAPSTPAGDAPLWPSRWKEDRPALDVSRRAAAHLVRRHGHVHQAGLGRVRARALHAGPVGAGATATIRYCYDAGADHGGCSTAATPTT